MRGSHTPGSLLDTILFLPFLWYNKALIRINNDHCFNMASTGNQIRIPLKGFHKVLLSGFRYGIKRAPIPEPYKLPTSKLNTKPRKV